MLVIFDLDLTLINTSALQTLRDNRRWREIKSRLGETNLYPGIREMVQAFRDKNISMAVVTNSPDTYAKDLLFHHSLPVKTVVAYHDTRRHKPYPDPMELAMQLSHSTARNTVAIGDAVNDIRAAKAAGTTDSSTDTRSSQTTIRFIYNPPPDCMTVHLPDDNSISGTE